MAHVLKHVLIANLPLSACFRNRDIVVSNEEVAPLLRCISEVDDRGHAVLSMCSCHLQDMPSACMPSSPRCRLWLLW